MNSQYKEFFDFDIITSKLVFVVFDWLISVGNISSRFDNLQKTKLIINKRLSKSSSDKWDKQFKSGPSKICGRQAVF